MTEVSPSPNVTQTAEFIPSEDDYALTVASLNQLGIQGTTRQPIPEYGELKEALDVATSRYLSEQAARGDQPELTFNVPIGRDRSLTKFLAGLGMKRTIWNEIWLDRNHNHDMSRSKLTPVYRLNDTTDPRNRSSKANEHDEAGLVYTGQYASHQHRLMKDESAAAACAGVRMRPDTISQYIVALNKRRLAGLTDWPLLDEWTATCFPQYSKVRLQTGRYERAYIPQVSVSKDRDNGDTTLILGGLRTDSHYGRRGVRRGVVVNLPKQNN